MKVVLFCGGLGTRIREFSETVPKPMVPIGHRPILWHVMKYYAHFGHKEFILCLGYGAGVIKDYFLHYNECASNDFVMSEGGKRLNLVNTDIHDWSITFADTGVTSNIAQRLKAVDKYLGDDPMFMANYSDGLTDLPLLEHLDHFIQHKKIASFVSVKPRLSYSLVKTGKDSLVASIQDMDQTETRINGGYFIFKREMLNHIMPGEEIVHEPFQRLIKGQQLISYNYDGFWASMDTFKDKQMLDEIYGRGNAPWEVWKKG